jgi:hypothetical protein
MSGAFRRVCARRARTDGVVVLAIDGEISKYPDESSGLLLLASDIGLCTERRPYQSLCSPADVPSDQSATTTANTRIGGSPFIWDGSFDEKNQ